METRAIPECFRWLYGSTGSAGRGIVSQDVANSRGEVVTMECIAVRGRRNVHVCTDTMR